MYTDFKDLIHDFNAKNRSAAIDEIISMAFPTIELMLSSIPVNLIGITNTKGIVKKLVSMRAITLSESENIPLAIANNIKSILAHFMDDLPYISQMYKDYMDSHKDELQAMRLDTEQAFIQESFVIYMRYLKTLQSLDYTILIAGFNDYFSAVFSNYISNIPTILGIKSNNPTVFNGMVDKNSPLYLGNSLRYLWYFLCHKYSNSLAGYDGTIYIDFNAWHTPQEIERAFTSFLGQSILILAEKRNNLSLRVPHINNYVCSVIRAEIIDRISRGTSKTPAFTIAVGNKTSLLENPEDDIDRFRKMDAISQADIDECKEYLYARARLNLTDRKIINNILESQEGRPRYIAPSLGMSVKMCTEAKCRAKKRLIEYAATAQAHQLFEYYGIDK